MTKKSLYIKFIIIVLLALAAVYLAIPAGGKINLKPLKINFEHQFNLRLGLDLQGGSHLVYEADLKDFFGSLNHDWLIEFVEHRIGDPRIISLIRRWLKAGILEKDRITIPELGVHQGGSISVLLSNIYLNLF